MFNTMQKTLCSLAVLAATSLPALAAEHIDVKVLGTISAVACTPSLAGGGTVDYGTIKTSTLSADSYTFLAEKQIDFSITCDGPAKVALQAVNGRKGTLPTEIPENAFAGYDPSMTFFGRTEIFPVTGLGLDPAAAADKNRIGGYAIKMHTGALADGKVVDTLITGNDNSWLNTPLGGPMYHNTLQRSNSWAATGTTTPVAFTTLSGTLSVQAFINKTSALDLTHEIQLDGLTTLELVYL